MANLSNLRQTKQDQQETIGLDSAGVLGITGQGAVHYTSLDSLPATGLTEGSKALVETDEFNRLYLSDGNGWYNVGFNITYSPSWDSAPQSSYTIADSVTPLVITALAIDSDTPNLINQSILSDSGQYLVDVTIDSSVFTFTPKSADSIGQEVTAGNLTDSNNNSFTYTFKFSDGISVVSQISSFIYNLAGAAASVAARFGDYTSRIDSANANLDTSDARYLWVVNTVMLNDNRFITVYVDDDYYQWVIGGKIDGDTITVGDTIALNPGKQGRYIDLATDGEVAVCIYQDRHPYYSIDHGSTEEKAQERWSFARVIRFTTSDGLVLERGSSRQACENPVSNTPNRGFKPQIAWVGGNNWMYVSGRFSRAGIGNQVYANYGSFTRNGLTLTSSKASTALQTESLSSWTFSEFDPSNSKVLVSYRTNAGQLRIMVFTVTQSTGNVSPNTTVGNNPGNAISQIPIASSDVSIPYDANEGKWVYVYSRNGVRLLTIDGSSSTETYGTEHTILPSNALGASDLGAPPCSTSAYYHAGTQSIRLFARTYFNTDLAVLPVTINSSSSISFDSANAWIVDSDYGSGSVQVAYNDSSGKGVAWKYSSGLKVASYTDNGD